RPARGRRCRSTPHAALRFALRYQSRRKTTTTPEGTFPEKCPQGARCSALAGVDRFGELGGDIEQVADDAEVCDLEDRRFRVLVHRDDRLRRLHSGAVLDRTGNTESDVELRGDGLAGLAHLELCR